MIQHAGRLFFVFVFLLLSRFVLFSLHGSLLSSSRFSIFMSRFVLLSLHGSLLSSFPFSIFTDTGCRLFIFVVFFRWLFSSAQSQCPMLHVHQPSRYLFPMSSSPRFFLGSLSINRVITLTDAVVFPCPLIVAGTNCISRNLSSMLTFVGR